MADLLDRLDTAAAGLTRREEALGALPLLTPCGDDENDTVVASESSHRSPRQDRFIIGVRVEEDDGRHVYASVTSGSVGSEKTHSTSEPSYTATFR